MGQRGEHSRSAHLRAHVKSRGNTNTTTTVVVAGAPGRVRVSDGRRRREGWRPLPDRRLSNGNRTRSLNSGMFGFFVNTSAKLKMNVYTDLKFHALFLGGVVSNDVFLLLRTDLEGKITKKLGKMIQYKRYKQYTRKVVILPTEHTARRGRSRWR